MISLHSVHVYVYDDVLQVFDTGAENQGQVVACLEENVDKISVECKQQIRKKEEKAAENIELDTALFKVSRDKLIQYVCVCACMCVHITV